MASETPDDAEEFPDRDGARPRNLRESLILLGRDVGIALLVVLIVFGAIFAYTQNWPPEVVVESSSMQHSDVESFIGAIDTGDIVLVQATPTRPQVTTWVEGKGLGHSTYGDFGDVIVYRPPPSPGDTPIIHRSMFFVVWNETGDGYDVPSLLAIPGGQWEARDRNGSILDWPYAISGILEIRGMGFRGDLRITFDLREFAIQLRYQMDGYVTMGDNNADRACSPPGPNPCPAKPYDRWIVPHANVIGKARGELPWFGLIKLLVTPAGGCCAYWGDTREAPKNSWDALAVSLALLIAAPFALDFGLSFALKRWKARRKRLGNVSARERDDTAADPEPAEPPQELGNGPT